METNFAKYKDDLESLIAKGEVLLSQIQVDKSTNKNSIFKTINNPDEFRKNYNAWYNESLRIIKQLMPERLDDFVEYYKPHSGSRKRIESNAIIHFLNDDSLSFSETEISIRFEQQFRIVESMRSCFDSSLYTIKSILQADLFDSELDAAKELQKKGFLRAAGAICGVVIERHLSQVCERRGIKVTKKNPSISDYKSILQSNDVIDVQQMRRIELMADIRNKCDHNKNVEPTDDDITEIISGTNKIIKSIY